MKTELNKRADSFDMGDELKLHFNLNKLIYLSDFEYNWNGNGADRISQSLLNKLWYIVCSLDRQPELFPTASNSIQLEYDGPDNTYLEIEITDSEDTEVEVYQIDKNGVDNYFNTILDPDVINKLVDDFYNFEITIERQ